MVKSWVLGYYYFVRYRWIDFVAYMIRVNDIVLHTLSKLYYICENKKQERWMNMNPYYVLQDRDVVPRSYFEKAL